MYDVLKFSVRLALRLYFGRIRADLGSAPPKDHTLLLACNHPNSFLDALVVSVHLPQRMRFMARGDAFRAPWAAKALYALYMIPIQRMSEGRAALRRTEVSFAKAQDALAQQWSVLVFAEGISVHGPGLRPLGKGAARMAYNAWQQELDIRALPVWIGYDAVHRPFADISITCGEPMSKDLFEPAPGPVFLQRFNGMLRQRLLAASEKAEARRVEQNSGRSNGKRSVRRLLFSLPAAIGLLLHAPWYFALRGCTACLTRGTVFFDSVLFALLFLSYPLWLLALTGLGLVMGLKAWAMAVLLITPLSAVALRQFSLAGARAQ